MFKTSWHKLKSHFERPHLQLLLKKGCYVLVAFVGSYYILNGLGEIGRAWQQKELNKQTKIEIAVTTENAGVADFLYEKNDVVAIVKPEEFNPILFQKSQNSAPIYLEGISELVAQQVSFSVQPKVNSLYGELEQCDQSILDKIYEEELPDNVIDELHINTTDVKKIKFIPQSKPLYFGKLPVIAIVIDDMGISQRRTHDIASLQAPLTASFLTYSRNLDQQVANSQKSGQEIMIHVPMEAQKRQDEAPDVLTTLMSHEEIKNGLEEMLEKFNGVKGINNHMGSKLTEDEARMEAVMEVLKDNNLFFLDSKTSANSKAEIAAKNQQVAYAHRHVFLDNNNDKAYILGQLALTEKLAHKNGYAVAIGHPKSQTYEALKEWLKSLDKKNIKLVPLSQIVDVLNKNH